MITLLSPTAAEPTIQAIAEVEEGVVLDAVAFQRMVVGNFASVGSVPSYKLAVYDP